MSITYDNASPDASSSTSGTSIESTSWALGGIERYTLAGVISVASSLADPSAVKWQSSGGTSLSLLGSTQTVNTFLRGSMYGLVAPTATTNTSYASWGSAQDYRGIQQVSYNGVDQTTPLRNSGVPVTAGTPSGVTNTGTIDISVTVTGVQSGDKCVAVFVIEDTDVVTTTITAGASTTVRKAFVIAGEGGLAIAEADSTGTTCTLTVTVAVSASSSHTGWYAWGVGLIPASSATLEQADFRFYNDDGTES